MSSDEPGGDEHLSIALRRLPIPDHDDGFWIELDDRLLEDRRARHAAQGGDNGESGGGPTPAEAGPVERMHTISGRADPRRAVTPLPGPQPLGRARYTQDPSSIVLQLARNVGDIAPYRRRAGYGRRPRRRIGLGLVVAVAVIATLIAVGVLVGGTPGEDDAGPGGALGLLEEVSTAMAAPASLSGGLTITDFPLKTGAAEPISKVYTFVWRVDGSYRVTAADGTGDEGYDASTGLRRVVQIAPGFGSIVREARNVAPGPPDGQSPQFQFANAVLGVFHTVLADPTAAQVYEEERDGREADVLETPLVRATETGPDVARMFVDPETGLPFAVTTLLGEVPFQDLRLDNPVTDAPLGAENFVVPVPTNAQLIVADVGYRRLTSPAEATAIVGYAAASATYLPQGFKLAEVAVAAQSQSPGVPNPDGSAGAPQVGQGVILLSYRRGFEQLVVTTRRGVTPPSAQWIDPFGVPPEGTSRPIELDGGRFSGVTVQSVRPPGRVPHLWGQTDELVFTVAGFLPANELVRVAESLD